METNKGTLVIELDHAKAPVTCENFLRYVQDGFYDGKDGHGETVFHRVIPGFMIQGGGMTAPLKQKRNHDPIVNESNNGLKNLRGTLSMARTNDPNSATSQFFINVANNDFLNYKNPSNPGYAVFAKVVEGMDVADAIVKVKTKTVGPHENVPAEAVTITKAEVVPETK